MMNQDAKIAIILLLKGIFYKKDNEKAFFELIESSYHAIVEYFATIGLEVHIHEDDGYAYLQNIEYENEEDVLPKLIPSRMLNYKVSLLCVLLRQKIAQFESQSQDERAIITKEDILAMLLLFLDIKFNESKVQKEIEATIKKVEDLGFLKRLKGDESAYEIKSSIKAFVDAKWLNEFDQRLQAYQEADEWKS
ncbi:MAG: DUF4194 domain-containing protein [Campylobacterales bacterium]|nr:DUF4194 domain-containing protein [Campylobacterales bacterium]